MKLPDGSTTRSKAVWSAGWRVVGESVERALGWTLLDYDPDFVFDTPSGSVKVDVAIALSIHRLSQEMAVLKACLSYATSNPLPVYDPLPREGLTPEAFVESCKRGRPTKHLHGWLARDLGKMVETMLLEREQAHALIQELGHKCDSSAAKRPTGEWKRQSRLKEEAWRWAADRLRMEVTVEEVDHTLSDEELEKLAHVRNVVCKTLVRQADRIKNGRKGKREKTLVEAFGFDKLTDEQKRENLLVNLGIAT